MDLTFSLLSKPLSKIEEHQQKSLEKFVSKLYCKDLDTENLDLARRRMVFEKAYQCHQLPPSSAALIYHSLRALYQGGHVWGKALQAEQNLDDPCKYGWKKEKYGFVPFWTHLPPISESVMNRNCSCKSTQCKRNCSCNRLSIKCTSLCACKGVCTCSSFA